MTTPPSREPDDADRGILRWLGDAAALLALMLPAVGLLGRLLAFALRGMPMPSRIAAAQTVPELALVGFFDVLPGLTVLAIIALSVRTISPLLSRAFALSSHAKKLASAIPDAKYEAKTLGEELVQFRTRLWEKLNNKDSPTDEAATELEAEFEQLKQRAGELSEFVETGEEETNALIAESNDLLDRLKMPRLLDTRWKVTIVTTIFIAVTIVLFLLGPWPSVAFGEISGLVATAMVFWVIAKGRAPSLTNLWPAVLALGLFGSLYHAAALVDTWPAEYRFAPAQTVEDGRYLLLGTTDGFQYLWPCGSETELAIAAETASVTAFTPSPVTRSRPSLLDVIRQGSAWVPSLADVCARQP